MTDDPLEIGFVCVQNAGRSQMATAYAERERAARGLEERLEIRTGGTHPADALHPVVVEAMAEAEIDVSGRVPRKIDPADLESCDYVATMGCSTLELDADAEVRDWDFEDPHGRELSEVRDIREEIRTRVEALFDELEAAQSAE